MRVWQNQILPPPSGEPARWWTSPPGTVHPKWQMKVNNEIWEIQPKWKEEKARTRKENKKRMDINPTAAIPHTSVGLCAWSIMYDHLFGREVADFSSHQKVHHHLVTLFNGKLISELYVSASAHFPAHHHLHHLPAYIWLISPPAAMAEVVLPHLARCPSPLQAFIVLTVTKPF